MGIQGNGILASHELVLKRSVAETNVNTSSYHMKMEKNDWLELSANITTTLYKNSFKKNRGCDFYFTNSLQV